MSGRGPFSSPPSRGRLASAGGRRSRRRSPRARGSAFGWLSWSAGRCCSSRRKRVGRRGHHTQPLVLKSFQLTVNSEGNLTAGFDVEAAERLADSGQLDEDLTDLLVALGEAARDHDSGVVFLLDEVQFLGREELEALIAALHRSFSGSFRSPLSAPGYRSCRAWLREAKSYAERLFKFPMIGGLSDEQAAKALAEPAARLDVFYEPEALAAITDFTQGYPYFLQEFGNVLWSLAERSPLTLSDVAGAQEAVEAKLDAGFFRVRVERTSELELRYLRAMAELGSEPQRAKDRRRDAGQNLRAAGPDALTLDR